MLPPFDLPTLRCLGSQQVRKPWNPKASQPWHPSSLSFSALAPAGRRHAIGTPLPPSRQGPAPTLPSVVGRRRPGEVITRPGHQTPPRTIDAKVAPRTPCAIPRQA